MITIRKSKDRGHATHGWLESYHTFSFADYFDPRFNSFRSLRVINEDWIAAAEGFGSHPHKDMEILTYVIEGELEHKDSMGNEGIIKAGDVQKMSAGSGVVHSEFNASQTAQVHLLQIWILPAEKGIKPSYQQMSLPTLKDGLSLIPISFVQDILIYLGFLNGSHASYVLKPGRAGWIQVVKGELDLNGHILRAGDAAAIEDEAKVNFKSSQLSEFLLFDLK